MLKSTINLIEKKTSKRISTGEILGLQSDLASVGGLKNLRIYHETLPAGHRSSPPHRHTSREEFIYVLLGSPSIWIDGTTQELKPGDFIALPAGTEQYHMVLNNNEEEAEILLIASIPTCTDDVIYLPDPVQVMSV